MRSEGGERCEEDELQSLVVLHVQVIAEGANGPTTIAAEKILLDRKVLVIPVSVHTCISPLSLTLSLSLSLSLLMHSPSLSPSLSPSPSLPVSLLMHFPLVLFLSRTCLQMLGV